MIEDLIFKDECYKIVGLAMKVYSKLGRGFREVVYKDALELSSETMTFLQREKPFSIQYEGVILPHHFYADLLVYNSIIIEAKAAVQFTTIISCKPLIT